MNEKKSFFHRVGNFMAGKGFYIVLFACVAVICVSAWMLLFAGKSDYNPDAGEPSGIIEDYSGDYTAPAMVETEIPEAPEEIPEDNADEPISTDADNSGQAEGAENSEQDNDIDSGDDDEEPAVSDGAPSAFVWPVNGVIEVGFSIDELVYSKTMADWRTHSGIDIESEIGTKVHSVADGVVEDVYNDDMFGTTVVIKHSGGLCSIYSNLASQPTVSVGDFIAMGSVIGSVGDTAIAESGEVMHLHFGMMLDGKPVNPGEYLPG